MSGKTAIVCNGTENKNIFPAFILGSSSAALGNKVIIFFTPSAAEALKKGVFEKMKGKGLPDLMEMVNAIQALNGKLYLCELALGAKELTQEDIREGVEIVGATSFMNDIQDADITFSF